MDNDKKIALRKPSPKTPHHILVQRKSVIMQMIIQGATLREIWTYVDEKTDWGVSERTVRRYYNDSEKEFVKSANVNVEKEMGKSLDRLNFLYARTVNLQDYKGALAVLREINELLGLKTLKIQIMQPEENLTIEEIEERLQELEAKGIQKGIKRLAPGEYLNTNTK